MAQPYVGEIRMFGGNFAPAGWSFCSGQLLAIAENETLFNLIGTTYGGDGQTTFGLPDLRGRLPMHMGPGFPLAQTGGAETVTLTVNEIPTHLHPALAQSGAGSQPSPAGGVWAASSLNQYSQNLPNTPMSLNAIGATGGTQPHSNFQPYLCVNFIISLFGIFPSQT